MLLANFLPNSWECRKFSPNKLSPFTSVLVADQLFFSTVDKSRSTRPDACWVHSCFSTNILFGYAISLFLIQIQCLLEFFPTSSFTFWFHLSLMNVIVFSLADNEWDILSSCRNTSWGLQLRCWSLDFQVRFFSSFLRFCFLWSSDSFYFVLSNFETSFKFPIFKIKKPSTSSSITFTASFFCLYLPISQ